MKNNILSRTVRPKAGCQSVRKADDLYCVRCSQRWGRIDAKQVL